MGTCDDRINLNKPRNPYEAQMLKGKGVMAFLEKKKTIEKCINWRMKINTI